MRARVLGPVELRDSRGPIPVGPPRQRTVLALLLVRANTTVSVDELIDELWPAGPPPSAVANVRMYAANVRRLLGADPTGPPAAVLSRLHNGYLLAVEADQFDLPSFRALVRSGREAMTDGDPTAALDRFDRADELWRGRALVDVRLGPALTSWQVAVEQERRAALDDHIEAMLGAGRLDRAAPLAQSLLLADPLRERTHGLLIRARYDAGDVAGALTAYDAARHVLVEQLGLEPGAELRELQQAVLNREPLPAVRPAATAPAVEVRRTPAHPVPAELPADVVSFTGRHAELDRLDRMLAERDASTAVIVAAITGTAGVGKTALAMHWAHRVRDRFPDGQLYANLAGNAEQPAQPADILARFLRALGVSAEAVPPDVEEAAALYRTLLADRSVMLVLDNARDGDQIRMLLPGGPRCLVLVTSRHRLAGLVDERRHRIALPALSPAEARTLIDRIIGAERSRREPDSVTRLAAACAHLPLALRIAAARLNIAEHRPIADYVAELDGNRLDALDSGGGHDNAVRAAFDGSYQRLPVDLRRLFRFLGVMPGPDFTVDAVAALIGEDPGLAGRLLDRLASEHLIEQPRPGRYAFHDLLRLYAKDLARTEHPLDDPAAAYGRLLRWQLRTVTAAGQLLYPQVLRLPTSTQQDPQHDTETADPASAVSWLEAERVNLVSAVVCAAEHGQDQLAGRLADELRGFFRLRHHPADWLRVAGSAVDAAVARQDRWQEAAARLSLGTAHQLVGAHTDALAQFTHGLAAARAIGWQDGEAAIHGAIGGVYRDTGKLEQAASHLSRALSIYRRTGRRDGRANHLSNLGLVYLELGRLRDATPLLEESLALHERSGSPSGQARALDVLGTVLRARGRLSDALIHLRRAAALHAEVGDQEGRAGALTSLSEVHLDADRLRLASANAGAALTLARRAGSGLAEGLAASAHGRVLVRQGQARRAIERHSAALRLARAASSRYLEAHALTGTAEALLQLGELDRASDACTSAATRAGAAGLRLLEANALSVRAEIHRRGHDYRQALRDARAALAVHRDTGHPLGEGTTLLVLADIMAKLGDPAEAATRRAGQAIIASTRA